MDAKNSANSPPEPALRRLRLRYPGRCVLCGQALEKGSEAIYLQASRTVQCIECKPSEGAPVVKTGSAGASAHREYERRRTVREVRVKAQLGNVIGGIALALTGDPQSTQAWERGSIGEQKLAEALAGVDELIALHDRRVP